MSSRLIDLLSLFVGVGAAAGLSYLILQKPPSALYEATALLLILIAVTGLTAPLWRLLLRKLINGADEEELTGMSIRFGFWTGLFIASLILLRILNFADRVLMLAILVLLIMIEMFLQQRAASKRGNRRTRR